MGEMRVIRTRLFPTKQGAEQDELSALANQLNDFNWRSDAFEQIGQRLDSDDFPTMYTGISDLKKILCTSRDMVYDAAQEVIDAKLIPRLVRIISTPGVATNIAQSAAFCLTNVAAGHDHQTAVLVEEGAIAPLIEFLFNEDSSLRRQAVFCLANVAGATAEERRMLVHHPRYFEGVFHVYDNTRDSKIRDLVVWNVRNCCVLGGPEMEDMVPAIRKFHEIFHPTRMNDLSGTTKFLLEAFAGIAKSPEGRACLARFDTLAAVMVYLKQGFGCEANKTWAFECMWRLMEYAVPEGHMKLVGTFVNLGGIGMCKQVVESHHSKQAEETRRLFAARIMFSFGLNGQAADHLEEVVGEKACRGTRSPLHAARLRSMREEPTPLEALMRVCIELEDREDMWIREGTAKAVCGLVAGFSDEVVHALLSPDLILVAVALVESSVDSETFYQNSQMELEEDKTESFSIQELVHPSGLCVGLTALVRLLEAGYSIMEKQCLPDNPCRVYFSSKEVNGPRRVQAAVSQTPILTSRNSETILQLLSKVNQ